MIHALLVALAVQAAPAGAAPPSSTPLPAVPSAAAATSDAGKLICRRTSNTGSRLGGEKECLTKAQWADRDVQNAQFTRDIQARGFQRPGPQ